MTRRVVVCIALVCVAAGMTLNTSLRVRTSEDRLAEVNAAIAQEEERIRVLTAEWHMLKSPARLETLATRHIENLGQIKPEQMASLADIPAPLPPAAPEETPAAEPEKPATVARAEETKPAPAAAPVQVAEAKPREETVANPDRETFLSAGLQDMAPAEQVSDIRTLIEREQAPCILWASAGGGQ